MPSAECQSNGRLRGFGGAVKALLGRGGAGLGKPHKPSQISLLTELGPLPLHQPSDGSYSANHKEQVNRSANDTLPQ